MSSILRPGGHLPALALISMLVLPLAQATDCAAEEPSEPTSAPTTELPSLYNARMPAEGLLAGGQPTEAVLKEAAEQGYRTVVDLRGASEERSFDEQAMVEALGMVYVSLPIANAAELGETRARQLADVLDDAAKRPVMVHCASGNRVGALLALRAYYVEGSGPEEALEFGRHAGLRSLEPKVEALLREAEATKSDPPR